MFLLFIYSDCFTTFSWQRMSYLFHILNNLLFCVNIYYSLTKEYDEINKVRL